MAVTFASVVMLIVVAAATATDGSSVSNGNSYGFNGNNDHSSGGMVKAIVKMATMMGTVEAMVAMAGMAAMAAMVTATVVA